MRRIFDYIRCAAVALLFISASVPIFAVEASPALMTNGDLHALKPGENWPADWPHGDGVTFEHDGDQPFLRLQSTKPGQLLMTYRAVPIPTPRPAAVEIKLRFRYSDIKPGEKSWFDGRFIFHFKNAQGKILKLEPPPVAFHGTNEKWVERDLFVKVPATAQMFEVMPSLFQAASGFRHFDFDELTI